MSPPPQGSPSSNDMGKAVGNTSSFLRLPAELLLEVATQCSQPDRYALSRTCRALRPAGTTALWTSPEISYDTPFKESFAARSQIVPRPVRLEVRSECDTWEWLLRSGSPDVKDWVVNLRSFKFLDRADLCEVARWISEHAPDLRSLTLGYATDGSADWGGIQLKSLTSLVANFEAGPNGAEFVLRFLQIPTELVHLNLMLPFGDPHPELPDEIYEVIAALPRLRSLELYVPYGPRPLPVCFIDALTRLESVSLWLSPSLSQPEGPGWSFAAELLRRGLVYPRLTSLCLTLRTVSDCEATVEALGRVWPQDMFPRLQEFEIRSGYESAPGPGLAVGVIPW